MNDERIDLYKQFEEINYIDPSYYEKFRVKRGLRNADGTGVLAGMTALRGRHAAGRGLAAPARLRDPRPAR